MGKINPTYFDRVRYTLTNPLKTPLVITEPDGWNEDDKEFAKVKNYEGVYTKFSNNLNFIEDGAEFIDDVKKVGGINAEAGLKKEERNPKTDVWETTYNAVTDLSEWSKDEFITSVKFIDSGVQSVIKANFSEKVEIERTTALDGTELEPLETKTLALEGRNVFLHSELNGIETETATTEVTSRGANFYTAITPIPLEIKSNSDSERIHRPIGTQVVNGIAGSEMFYAINDRTKKLRLSLDLSFTIEVDEYIKVSAGYKFIKVLLSIYENGVNYEKKRDIELYVDPNAGNQLDREVTITLDEEIELLEGESMMLYFYTGATTGYNNRHGYFRHNYKNCKGYLTISEDSFFEPSVTEVIYGHELGERLSQIITGQKGLFYSEYLGRKELGYKEDGKGAYKVYACGHWLRGFSADNSNEKNKYLPFTTSFKDFVNDLEVTEFLGLGIEKTGFREKIVLEPIPYFNQTQVLVNIPEQVSGVKRKVAKDKYISNIEIGYEKGYENEESMGLDEPNGKANFSTPIYRNEQDYKQISKYIYASYAGEFIRRKPILSYPLENHTNDKEIFVFDCKLVDGVLELKRWQDVLEVEPIGIYSPETAYNLTYSPINLLLKHKSYIASSLQYNLKDKVRFTSSEVVSKLKTQLKGGVELLESQDVDCNVFGVPLFEPEEIEFEYEVNFELIKQLEGTTIINGREVRNVYGLIQFINEKGQTEKGRFLSLKPNGKGVWKILKYK